MLPNRIRCPCRALVLELSHLWHSRDREVMLIPVSENSARIVMKVLIVILVLFSSGLFAIGVQAEGNCPPGYYPIGGQGVQGCAPIPAQRGAATSSPAPIAPRPTGQWIKTWGALAQSPGSELIGAANGLETIDAAKRLAIERCKAEGANDCRVSFTYMNQCMAFAAPRAGKGGSMMTSAATKDGAVELALSKCAAQVGGACTIVYSACAEPIFKRF